MNKTKMPLFKMYDVCRRSLIVANLTMELTSVLHAMELLWDTC